MINLFKAQEATQVTEEQKASFTDARPQWKALAAEGKITYGDMAALAIYRSMIKGEGKEGAISRIHKSFKPTTNPVKLENGALPYSAVTSALYAVKYTNLISWLSDNEKAAMIAIAKEIRVSGKEIK